MAKIGAKRSKQPTDTPSEISAPEFPYQPQDPQRYRPPIGLIGCGGITVEHLTAYRDANYEVVALCDLDVARAEARRDEFCPQADVYDDYRQLLARDDVEVVDITTHPPIRPAIIEAALGAGKHVLSQKPYVLDLDVGARLADLADQQGLRLAVNQNARWAPHFSYLRHAVAQGMIGQVTGVHCAVHWNHNWVAGTEFDGIKHLILYDFAIHWFDILCCWMGDREPRRVYASLARSPTQKAVPDLLGQASIEYEGAQATMVFGGDTQVGPRDTTLIAGTKGTITSEGASLRTQQVAIQTAKGIARPKLVGRWFPDGFHGTMAELLCAIEEDREPSNSARNNLRSLALCFAAVASAERGEPVTPGEVGRME
jgi:predicted dehydrogenase